MIARRDSPPPLGPGRITPWTLVAMTTSSREAISLSSRPVTSSLVPPAYTLAVSKTLMPASYAARTIGRAASSSRIHGCQPWVASPQLMQPRLTAETSRPVLPRRT